ncbi:MAG: PAS domain S-box protein [Actinomycetota bacterium]|nr:PAS domain S-box protein [Actinomycetota bacterium]
MTRRETEEYEALARVSPGATLIHRDGVILHANEPALTLFGIENRANMVGTRFLDYVHPLSKADMIECITSAAVGGASSAAVDKTMLHQDGAAFEAETGSVAIDYRGATAILTFVCDSSERNAAEIVQRTEETRYRNLFDNSPLALWEEDFSAALAFVRGLERSGITDLRAHFTEYPDELDSCLSLVKLVDVNDTACELFGAQSKSQLMDSLEGIIAPEAVNHAVDGLLAMMSGRRTFSQDTLNRRMDGSIMNVRLRWRAPQGEAGDYSRVMVLVEDVTHETHVERKLRESEMRYRTLVEMSPDAIVVHDGTTVLFANAATAQIANIPDAQALVGRPWREFVAPESATELQNHIADMRANGRPQEPTLLEFTLADGVTRKIEAIGMEIVYSGRPAVQTILRDITDRIRVQEMLSQYNDDLEQLVEERTSELLQTNHELEQATRAKSAFLASMSHELRTPLNSIIGFSGVLLQGLGGPLSPEQHRQIQMVNSSGRQLLDLVGDVLDLSKIESGRVEIEEKPVLVRRHIENLIDTVRPMAAENGLALRLELDSAPESIITDKQKLEQIVLNLLSNAIKYTESGSVTVRVIKTDSQVVYSVSDTGMGVAPEDHDTIFEEFRQLQSMTKAKHPGTGLGLPIARRLAGLLGGTITLSSKKGKGSTFSLVLPNRAIKSGVA